MHTVVVLIPYFRTHRLFFTMRTYPFTRWPLHSWCSLTVWTQKVSSIDTFRWSKLWSMSHWFCEMFVFVFTFTFWVSEGQVSLTLVEVEFYFHGSVRRINMDVQLILPINSQGDVHWTRFYKNDSFEQYARFSYLLLRVGTKYTINHII